jgi:hypothetical protein
MGREVVGEIQHWEKDLSLCESTNLEEVAYRNRELTIGFQIRLIPQNSPKKAQSISHNLHKRKGQSPGLAAQRTFAFCKLLILRDWSGRMDLNHRPPGPEPGALARLRYAPTVTLGCLIANQAGLSGYHSSALPSYSGHFPNNLSPDLGRRPVLHS